MIGYRTTQDVVIGRITSVVQLKASCWPIVDHDASNGGWLRFVRGDRYTAFVSVRFDFQPTGFTFSTGGGGPTQTIVRFRYDGVGTLPENSATVDEAIYRVVAHVLHAWETSCAESIDA